MTLPVRKLGLIVDGMTVTRWQAEALRALAERYALLIYSCTNSRPAKRRLRHALYYALNLVTIRNPQTRRTALSADLPIVATHPFEAKQQGAWQRLPDELTARIREDRPVALVKFGMGLLEVPPADALPIPILSYHHGDPAHFRGRPAGFYEMLSGAAVMGQVVQRLSNALDAGDIVASAETKVLARSYRATLIEAYRHSPLILEQAIENTLNGSSWKPGEWGRNYRLPGNALVVRFLLRQWRQAAARILYGLFKEKSWSVATAAVGDDADLETVERVLARSGDWRILPTPRGYRFLADPFLHPDGGLLVEALNARSCRGEIVHVTETAARRQSGRGGHYSYPATAKDGEHWYVVPEVSDWSRTKAFPIAEDGLGPAIELKVPGRPALLDPTPFNHEGKIYLFGNIAAEGASVLRLWFAGSLDDEFVEHPSSPIRISPNGARMAGSPCRIGGRLVRAGQDFRGAYGDGISLFAVTRLDPEGYAEESIGALRFDRYRGPHTLSLGRGLAAFDFYVERVSMLAGLRRWRDRRAARRVDQE